MKALLLAALLAQSPATPSPSPAGPVMRGDVQGVIGWQNLRDHDAQDHYNDWVNDIFYGGVGAGWYWTDHHKTVIDFGAGTRGDTYRYRNIVVGGVTTYEASRLRTQQTSLSIASAIKSTTRSSLVWAEPRLAITSCRPVKISRADVAADSGMA